MVTKPDSTELSVASLKQSSVKLRIIGTNPLFQNRMTNKVMATLLLGGSKKTTAEKAHIKHNPIEEYRNSAEIMHAGPTALGLRVAAVKGAMAEAAIETPGLKKTSINRLVFMPGDLVPLYGTPMLRMDVVRSADINRTPDVRSRAFLPKWGAEVKVSFVTPQLSISSVVTLLCNAGVLIGVGDFRQGKGKGGFGTFRVVGDGKDEEWDDLVKHHGRAAQKAALETPSFVGQDTHDLMQLFEAETKRRAS